MNLFTSIFSQTIEVKIDSLLAQMTLEEKILQLHHEGSFNTAYNNRLKIPGFNMADGPHGVRDGQATSFPVGIAMAATWSPRFIERVGQAMGREFYAKGKNQALGPCMDLTRDPRNGRSPESGGEDPFLCAMITSHLIKGIQKNPVIATAKHFNLVNHQINRTTNNVIINQRDLMEHYGRNFRMAVQMGGVFSVMNSYNLINGEKAAENYSLLTDILRNKWGFPFYVVSDWGSIWNTEKAIKAGCNVCMGSDHYQNDLLSLVMNGNVSVEEIDRAVRAVLRTKLLSGMFDFLPAIGSDDINSAENRQISLEAAEKSVILLKNVDHILPINVDSIQKIAIIGPSAAVAQLDGAGSSYVTPFYSVSPLQALQDRLGAERILYARGCDINSNNTDGFQEAIDAAEQADIVLFFGGLDNTQEGEGFDRIGGSVLLPTVQSLLLNQLAAVNENLIAIIESGGICSMAATLPVLKGLLYAFYPGQEGGNAIANVLLGNVNPGGKLPVSMPVSDSQLPQWNDDFTDDYLCGYRWYDATDQTPLFPFGYGLSYTRFVLSNLRMSQSIFHAGDSLAVLVDVTNTGDRFGDEVVQLYLAYPDVSFNFPEKQLQNFERVSLAPGESKTVRLMLSNESFYHYNVNSQSYSIAPGIYRVMVGNSSDSLPLQIDLPVQIEVLKGDLVPVRVLTYPRFPIVGDSLHILVVVKNDGLIKYTAGTILECDIRWEGMNYQCQATLTGDLEPGGIQLLEFRHENSSSGWPASRVGNYPISLILNPNNTIDEYPVDNNQFSQMVEIYLKPSENLALHKPVFVSSIEGSGLEGENAVDGILYTRWSSAFNEPETIRVDLNDAVSFNHIRLIWETAYGKRYVLQSSNDLLRWKDLKLVSDGTGGIEDIYVSDTARYVRMIGLERATQWGFSLYEFQVYDDADSTVLLGDDFESEKTLHSELLEAWPNPFNPEVKIRLRIGENGLVRMVIYNLLGQKIETILDKKMEPGVYQFNWNASGFPNGVYVCRVQTPRGFLIQKLLLLK